MEHVIFQASDLAKERVKVLDAARAGKALVRDKDGTGLVMLPEERLAVLEGYASWSQQLQRLNALLNSGRDLTITELGELAWLRVFDRDDLRSFSDELHDALISGLADSDLVTVHETIAAWKVTARQLEDPLRRSVLLRASTPDDFVEVEPPA